ncbi:Hypothetical protein, putative [Bodo saltans]|uniref:Uncharacterized protein n=1 Tax=Bodo saltans TaxID=75058 RepID=A0A0S4KK51_BODSA|nr:Hypothetical protein, putative [Bodo saltans]|eukprot:CUI12912.1 Hypothetical protein, putative [Bodo saltans]
MRATPTKNPQNQRNKKRGAPISSCAIERWEIYDPMLDPHNSDFFLERRSVQETTDNVLVHERKSSNIKTNYIQTNKQTKKHSQQTRATPTKNHNLKEIRNEEHQFLLAQSREAEKCHLKLFDNNGEIFLFPQSLRFCSSTTLCLPQRLVILRKRQREHHEDKRAGLGVFAVMMK